MEIAGDEKQGSKASPMTPWFLAEVSENRRRKEFLIILSDPDIPQHHKIQPPHFRDADRAGTEREQDYCPKPHKPGAGRASVRGLNPCCFDYNVPSAVPIMLSANLLGCEE